MPSRKLVEKSCRSRKLGGKKEDMMVKRPRGGSSGGCVGGVDGGSGGVGGGGGRPVSASCGVGRR
jgi:hypothetical protein